MTRILLTGIAGQVGQELQRTLTPLGDVVGVDRRTIDLAQSTSIRQVISEVKPDAIVNAAAYTAVDKAETEAELAKSINAIAPTIIAESAQRLGATLIHISTDYVFDGRKNNPYTEKDAPNPINVYGQSKLVGEEGIRQNCDRYIILRTAWVYGAYGKSNFVKTMLRLGAERDELRVVADQIGSPTWARGIAQAIAALLSQFHLGQTSDDGEIGRWEGGENVHKNSLDVHSPHPPITPSPHPLPTGTYHFTNSGVASWYDFAVAIFEEARLLGFPLKVQRVVPITTTEYPTPAQRPAYSVLSCQKIAASLGYPSHWREGLRQMLVELYKCTYESNHSQRR